MTEHENKVTLENEASEKEDKKFVHKTLRFHQEDWDTVTALMKKETRSFNSVVKHALKGQYQISIR